jgi:GTP cyclohydrolase I
LRILSASPPIDIADAEEAIRSLQVQERLTQQIADCLDTHLNPKGVGVVIEAEHQCMTLRGVRAHGSRTLTSALLGHLRADAAARQEFLNLAQ